MKLLSYIICAIKKTLTPTCKFMGHNWKYKNHLSVMNDLYGTHFRASRACKRCHKSEYLYKEWTAVKNDFPVNRFTVNAGSKIYPEMLP